MHDTIVTIRHLQKRFGDVQAVRDVSLQVRRGELFAFLGLNGAGKSTTISILCGQLARDGGDVLIDGQSIDENTDGLKQMLGVVFQNSVLDKALSVRDNLRIRAALYGISGTAYKERLAELAALLEFEDLLGRPVGKLSGGQRRRIDVARALLHRPRLLILDEPTTGLDPQTRATLWGVIARLRKETQMTVFLTTHYMEEAAEADYITILDSGEVAAEGTPLQLKNAYAEDALLLYGAEEQDVQALGRPYERKQNAFRIPVRTPEEATALILQKPALFKDFELLKGSMDDVFLRVTGKTLPGGDAQ